MDGAPVTVGVDGSKESLQAVEVAAAEATLLGTGLRVVHAFVWPPTGPYLDAVSPGLEDSVIRAGAEQVVDEAVAHARQAAPVVRVDGVVSAGDVLGVMLAETETARLVVVGSRGLGALGRVMLGSVAVRLSAHGHCPVLVVRGRPDPTRPIVLAVDGSPAGAAAVDFAFAEAALRNVGIVAVHAWSAEDAPPPRVLPPAAGTERREAAERLLAETLAGPASRYPRVSVEHRAVRGQARKRLIDASADAGLMVVGARGRGGFAGLLLGSVSQALLSHAHCPVAVVRGTGEGL